MSKRITDFSASRSFVIVSWVITGILVVSMLGFGFIYYNSRNSTTTELRPTATQIQNGMMVELPDFTMDQDNIESIARNISLKTNIPERPRYIELDHEVDRGESIFSIAKSFEITPETLLWANYDALKDSPDSLRIGMVLRIPPTNGVLYEWQEGDTFELVADNFDANLEDILTWPGNDIDLLQPAVEPGTFVMIPGGSRGFVQFVIGDIPRGSSGTSSVNSSSACGEGPVGSGAFVWPADNHYLSGNDYWSGHLAIDIAAGEGAPVYAADSGVVTKADGGYNGGYGNVIMIDHGNGYFTLYAHLSQINVVTCQDVYAGNMIGRSGNTGNSFGAHLHFEVRRGGEQINPWYVLP